MLFQDVWDKPVVRISKESLLCQGHERKWERAHWGTLRRIHWGSRIRAGPHRHEWILRKIFYSPAQEHVSYLRSKTQQNSHLSKYKTKVQRTRNFAFEMRKNPSLLLPSERDQWGVNNIIPYMCSFSRLPLHWGLYFSSKIPLSFTRLPYLQP